MGCWKTMDSWTASPCWSSSYYQWAGSSCLVQELQKDSSFCTLKWSMGWWAFTPCNKIQKLAFQVAWDLGSSFIDLFEAFLKKQIWGLLISAAHYSICGQPEGHVTRQRRVFQKEWSFQDVYTQWLLLAWPVPSAFVSLTRALGACPPQACPVLHTQRHPKPAAPAGMLLCIRAACWSRSTGIGPACSKGQRLSNSSLCTTHEEVIWGKTSALRHIMH